MTQLDPAIERERFLKALDMLKQDEEAYYVEPSLSKQAMFTSSLRGVELAVQNLVKALGILA